MEQNFSGRLGRVNTGRAVGGTTVHYTAMTLRLDPSDFRVESTDGIGADWPLDYDELAPYIKNGMVWICPSDKLNPNDKNARLAPPSQGYHMNGNLITATGLAEASVAAPSNCQLMREAGWGYVWLQSWLRPFPKDCDAIVDVNGKSLTDPAVVVPEPVRNEIAQSIQRFREEASRRAAGPDSACSRSDRRRGSSGTRTASRRSVRGRCPATSRA